MDRYVVQPETKRHTVMWCRPIILKDSGVETFKAMALVQWPKRAACSSHPGM